MTPKEYAKYYREKFPNDNIEDLIVAIRSASKYGFWHQSQHTELVVKELKKLY